MSVWPFETIARRNRRSYAGNILSERRNELDPTQPDFWSQRYVSERTPWQLDGVPKRLSKFIRSLRPGGNVLIPGCGQDYRTIDAFHGAGHRVTAIDFSPIAVDATKKALPAVADGIILGDFFTYNFEAVPFDLVYERTFLCSLPPRLWKHYATRVAELLCPRGIFAGFFLYGKESDPPPYPLNESKATEILAGRFNLKKSEPVSDSLSIFAGQEKWQEWQKR
jgi:SAM-dependent methyltransferase